jgi:hypothetical protein
MFPFSGKGRGRHTLLSPLDIANLKRRDEHTETDPGSESLCFVVFRILDDGQSPETE